MKEKELILILEEYGKSIKLLESKRERYEIDIVKMKYLRFRKCDMIEDISFVMNSSIFICLMLTTINMNIVSYFPYINNSLLLSFILSLIPLFLSIVFLKKEIVRNKIRYFNIKYLMSKNEKLIYFKEKKQFMKDKKSILKAKDFLQNKSRIQKLINDCDNKEIVKCYSELLHEEKIKDEDLFIFSILKNEFGLTKFFEIKEFMKEEIKLKSNELKEY